MKLLCWLGFHNWNGCKCIVCGHTRNQKHEWLFIDVTFRKCLNCFRREVQCTACTGSGQGEEKCPSCSGSGEDTRPCGCCYISGTGDYYCDTHAGGYGDERCPQCQGSGHVPKICNSCNGKGWHLVKDNHIRISG